MAESNPNGYKTLWEKEKLLVMSNFSFSQCFQKACFPGRQKVSFCGNGLTTLSEKPFENIVEKGENDGNQHFLLFPQYFSTLSKTKQNICVPCFGVYNPHIFSALNNFKLGTACYTLQ